MLILQQREMQSEYPNNCHRCSTHALLVERDSGSIPWCTAGRAWGKVVNLSDSTKLRKRRRLVLLPTQRIKLVGVIVGCVRNFLTCAIGHTGRSFGKGSAVQRIGGLWILWWRCIAGTIPWPADA
jgi:hypothetical protein